jgi:hypothetical protein
VAHDRFPTGFVWWGNSRQASSPGKHSRTTNTLLWSNAGKHASLPPTPLSLQLERGVGGKEAQEDRTRGGSSRKERTERREKKIEFERDESREMREMKSRDWKKK